MLRSFLDTMMEFFGFFMAFIAGFVAALPVSGPVTMMILRRTVEGEHRKGVALGLGAALMEMVYCAVGISIVGVLLEQIHKVKGLLGVVSSVLLFVVGIYFLMYKIGDRKKNKIERFSRNHERKHFITGMVLVGLNPVVIFTWSAISASLIGLGVVSFEKLNDVILFAVFAGMGIFTGSLALIGMIWKNRKLFSEKVLRILFRVFGVILMISSFYSFYKLI
tara:strand:+ start:636 stop:1298 length:663 start_codon:yes stop_codon:yes gene_type:complete